jgi:hypothetical protein
MFKRIKKLFKKNPLNPISNSRGSILPTALIVIVILTFSVTSITSLSVNLAANTTMELENVGDENLGKAKIKMAIADFQEFIGVTYPGDYDSYLVSGVNDASDLYDVDVTDVTSITDGYGDFGDKEARAFKFTYTLTDGDILVMYCYVSNFGSTVENFNPFDYSIGTNGSLILNSGYYDEIQLFGDEVLMAGETPYVVDGGFLQAVTPQSSEVFPVLTTGTPSVVFNNSGYQYCEASCFTLNVLANPFMINNTSNYNDVEGSALPDQGDISEMLITDFFGTFDYDQWVVDWVTDEAPKGTNTITDTITFETIEDVVMDNSSPVTIEYKNNGTFKKLIWPNDDFADITDVLQYVYFDSDFKQGQSYRSMVHTGELHIDTSLKIFSNESLIVFGDLYIDAAGAQNIEGQVLVSGNLYIEGGSKDFEGSIIVFGQTFIDFDNGNGITTNGNNIGFTVMARDHIHFNRIFESHTSSALTAEFTAFIYTEESIFIDAVNSRINLSGPLYARALGNSYIPGNPLTQIFMNYETGLPLNGIVINSYQGYINSSGQAVPNSSTGAHGFRITVESNGNYQDRFINIPVFDSIVVTLGEFDFFNSEFTIE